MRGENGHISIAVRRCATRAVMARYGVETKADYADVTFDIVGLWDTVEALGFPDFQENVDVVNPRYADQICNMERVFHAVSLDDNRASTYTPILMTRQWLMRDCDIGTPNRFDGVEEVWFAGDHAQVGGTEQRGHIAGVSLNWMLERIRAETPRGHLILPPDAKVFEQPLDFIKDAEGQSLLFRIFSRNSRNPLEYALTGACDDGDMRSAKPHILIHRSVVEALERQTELIPNRRDPDEKLGSALSKDEVLQNRQTLLGEQSSRSGCNRVPVLVSDNMQDVTNYLAPQ